MATLSPARANVPLLQGLKVYSRGKVRDTYSLPYDNRLLSEATDGISIFDFVLDALVPQKGQVLNAMNHFWLTHLAKFGFATHLMAYGRGIDACLPTHLRGNPDLQSRALVVRQLDMVPVEFIARAVLTGSAVKPYQITGCICDHRLPSGLQDGDALPYVLDTPTTKAVEGHDQNLSAPEVRQRYPEQTYTLLQVFQIASQFAKSRGIKLADTKLEFGADGTIADEVFTPDSSRFWEYQAWHDGREAPANRKAPPPYDKQLVRTWGIEQGIHKIDPANPGDVAKVHALQVPEALIRQTTQTYRYIFWRLTGMKLELYLKTSLGVELHIEPPKIAIVCGSQSDLPMVLPMIDQHFPGTAAKINVHVVSCHRHPEAVRQFAKEKCGGADVVIGVGSKALALPGILDAWLYFYQHSIPVIGVALGEPSSTSFRAAALSIEELPGAPVLMDEITGQCFQGQEGLLRALQRVVSGEFPPFKPRTTKPMEMKVHQNY